MNEHAELLRWLRTELNIICEATTSAPDLLSIASDGQFSPFARGRIHEAEQIKIKMGEIIQTKFNEYPAHAAVRKPQ